MAPVLSAPALPLSSEDLDLVLSRTELLWADLRGERLFITGGTGFFGLWLLETFMHANRRLGLGAEAVVLTRDPNAIAAKIPHLLGDHRLQFWAGDVRSFEPPDGTFSHVIHAGTTSSAPVEPRMMFDTIVEGTRRVLEFAAAAGTRRLLFTSSGAVYGRQPDDVSHLPETFSGAPDPTDAASAYGEGKRAAELLCTMAGAHYGFEAKIARCFAFVGPHLALDAHFAIGNFIGDALAGRPIRITGDARTMRSYLYAADLATWLWTILFRGAGGRAYNVGSGEGLSLGETAEIVRDATSGVMGPLPPQGANARRSVYVPDVARAAQELGLGQSLTLRQSVVRTLQWHRDSARLNGRPS